MRLIGYCRVSRVAGREGDSFISVPQQKERIEQHAAGNHVVVDWQTDLDQSGGKIDRPAFEAALAAVERGEADGIAVAKLDRFARSVAGAAKALERLETANGALLAADLNMDTTTAPGKLMRTVLMAAAEFELDRITENWRGTRENAIGRGVPVSRPPFGYRRGAHNRFEIDPEAAPVVRELFIRRGTGASWLKLAEFMDEKAPRENGTWTRQTIASMIKTRTYLGEAKSGDIVNPDAHPAIVTHREWELAQGTPRTASRAKDGGPLLAGIIRCASCGETLTRQSDGARGYRKYECRGRSTNGVCPAPVRISVTKADQFIEEMFQDHIDGEHVTAVGAPAGGDIEAALSDLEAAELELATYRDANLISVIGVDAYTAGITTKQRAVDEARETVTAINAAAPIGGMRDLATEWPKLSTPERRHLLGAVLDRVDVRRANGTGKGTPAADRMTVVWR